MNHVYRLKRSGRTQQLQLVPENARSAGKGASSSGTSLTQSVAATLASFALSGMVALLHAQQAPPAVNQLPQGGVVSRGNANINTSSTPAGNALMTVNQTSNRAVIDWNSFNVGANAKVQFNQPSSSAVVLNQILGNNASQIYGQISANGQVFLSNPNGIYFSPTAQVDVGGLVATTGRANADDFMAGKSVFNRAGATGSVVNDGQLNAALGGYIALLAPEVRNQGVIVAQAGTVALASGEAITLNFNGAGTGLAGITTTPQTIAALVENRSAVVAEGGYIVLSAHALASLQGSVVKNSGQLSASSLSTKGGKIVLMADSIVLTGTSRIDANGATGGGTVLAGGDWQGSGDTRLAVQVTMDAGATIEANATQAGDGGQVVLYSDISDPNSQTAVSGSISAQGGPLGGNGGNVETSGHNLQVGSSAIISTLAPQGQSGNWLLDPYDVTISSAAATNSSGNTATGSPSVINATALQTALGTGNVTVSTGSSGTETGNITVASNLSWSQNTVLTLLAAGGITGSGNIAMTNGTAPGVVFDQAGNSTYSGVISGNFAGVTKSGAGTLTLSGTNTYKGTTTVSAGTLEVTNTTGLGTTAGGTTVASGATLDINVSVGAEAIALSGTLTSSTTGTASLSGVISGTGAVTKTGAGTLTLSGANTYSGTTTVSAGTLGVFHATGLGTTEGGTTVASGATLNLRAAVGAEAIALSGTLTSNTTGTASLSGVISGTGAVTKTGA